MTRVAGVVVALALLHSWTAGAAHSASDRSGPGRLFLSVSPTFHGTVEEPGRARNGQTGAPDARALDFGTPVTRDMSPGEVHRYTTTLATGQAIHVTVAQNGIDVVIVVAAPDGTEIVQVDSPNGRSGTESIWLIATAPGGYTIEARAFPDTTAGRYEIALARVPQPSAAVRAYSEGLRLAGMERDRSSLGTAAAVVKVTEAVRRARATGEVGLASEALSFLGDVDRRAQLKALVGRSSTNKIPVYYSSGSAKRAIALRTMAERAMGFYERWLGVRVPVELAVLNEADWVQLGSVPYGIPYSTAPATVIMPTTVELFDSLGRTLTRGMPAAVLRQLQTDNISYETAIRDFTDAIVFHELGHLYVRAFGVAMPNSWLNEFLADYLLIACESNQVGKPAASQFREGMVSATLTIVHPEHTTLEDFERRYLGVGFSNYSWYQTQFMKRAAEVYKQKGLSFLSEVRDTFPADEPGRLPVAVVLDRLEKLSPGFLEWAEGMKSAGR